LLLSPNLSLLLSPNAGKTTNTVRKLNNKEKSKPKSQRPAPPE